MGIGERIRAIRKEHGFSQSEFGKIIGVSNGHISNAERETDALSDRVIHHLCVAFHLNEEWLRTGVGRKENLDDKILRQLDENEDSGLRGHYVKKISRAGEAESMQKVFAPAYPRYHDLTVLLTSDEAKDFRALLNAIIKEWGESDFRERLKIEIRLEDMFPKRVYEMRQRADALHEQVQPVPQAAKPHRLRIPVVGRAAAGEPIEMIEFSDEEWEAEEDDTVRAGDIIVEARGDSMIDAGINDGDYCLIRPNDIITNGSIALIRINGVDSTIKKFYAGNDGCRLVACNDAYEDMRYAKGDDVHVIGRFIKTVNRR